VRNLEVIERLKKKFFELYKVFSIDSRQGFAKSETER
jgi:hypothetical protein